MQQEGRPLARDHHKLRVFEIADALVVDVYRITAQLPLEERYGPQSQVRRATVSAAVNIVEGCARRTTREYVHFMTIALGSATEARYLLELAVRLRYIDAADPVQLDVRFRELIRSLQKLVDALADRRAPEAALVGPPS